MKDKLLFIPFMIFKKCDTPFKWQYSDFYYEIFMLGKRGVITTGIRSCIFQTLLSSWVPQASSLQVYSMKILMLSG